MPLPKENVGLNDGRIDLSMSQKLTQLTRVIAKITFTVDAFKNLRTPGAVVYANRFRDMRHDQVEIQRVRTTAAAASQLTRMQR